MFNKLIELVDDYINLRTIMLVVNRIISLKLDRDSFNEIQYTYWNLKFSSNLNFSLNINFVYRTSVVVIFYSINLFNFNSSDF